MKKSTLTEYIDAGGSKKINFKLYATETDGLVSVNFDVSLELLKDLALSGDKAKVGMALLEAIAKEIDK